MLLVWLVGGLFGFLVCRFINWPVGRSLSQLFRGLVVSSVVWLSVGQSVTASVGLSVSR
jgi:hypothetical protein